MSDFLLYIFKVNLSLIILYIFYRVFFKDLTFYVSNRIFLLGGVIISFILPLLSFDAGALPSDISVNVGVFEGYEIQMKNQIHELENNEQKLGLFHFMGVIYVIGVVLFLFQFISSLYRIKRRFKTSKIKLKDGLKYAISDSPIPPFSFWNSIFISKDNFENPECKSIIEHEKLHIKYWHSYDLILMETLFVFFWFNPFIILYKQAIRLNHEFTVDNSLLKNGVSINTYLDSLSRNLHKMSLVQVSNFYYGSIIKKRINMMTQNKSNRSKGMIYLLVIPLFTILMAGFSNPKNSGTVPAKSPILKEDIEKITAKFNVDMVDPFTQKVRKHMGIDIKAKEGTSIYAAGNGTAIRVEKNQDGWGNLIVIKHRDGFETWYAHMLSINIKENASIEEGQLIGYVGNSGKSTGPHLHFEVRENGIRIDPEKYIQF